MKRLISILILPAAMLVLTGCAKDNENPSAETVAAHGSICKKLTHASYFAECYQRVHHEIVRTAPGLDRYQPNVARTWDKQAEKIHLLHDSGGDPHFGQERLEQALHCQKKTQLGNQDDLLGTCRWTVVSSLRRFTSQPCD